MSKLTARTQSTDDSRFIQSAIDNGIRLKADELLAKHKEQFEKELIQVTAEVVASVSLKVASELNFQDTGNTIRFEIAKK